MKSKFLYIFATLLFILVSTGLVAKNVVKLSPKMPIGYQMIQEETEYVIQNTFDLNGSKLVIPEGCTLRFEKRGTIKNGTVEGSNTRIESTKNKIFRNIAVAGSFTSPSSVPEWFDGEDSKRIEKAIIVADTVLLKKKYTAYTTIHISKPTVVKASGQIIFNKTLPVGLSINSSNVSLDNIRLKTSSKQQDLLQAIGSKGRPLKHITITSCSLSGGLNGIRWDYVDDSEITHCHLQKIEYAAIAVHSSHNVDITFNHIKDINVYHNNQNSYGVAASFHYGHPKSTDIRINDNIVENNPYWEALDTHGGERIEFCRNTTRNCWRGVAAVSVLHNGVYSVCSDIIIQDNDIQCSDEQYSNGIVFTGADVNNLADKWHIQNNIIKNAVIGFYSNYTSNATVKDNTVSSIDEGWMDTGSRNISFMSNTIEVTGTGDQQYTRCGIFLIPISGETKAPFGILQDNTIRSGSFDGIVARNKFNYPVELEVNQVITTAEKYKGM